MPAPSSLRRAAVTGPCWAMAHSHARSSRAIAPTPCGRMVPPCAELPSALPPSALGLPPHVLERFGALGAAEWQGPTALRRGVRGPGPCHQGTTGRGRPGLREASLTSARVTGICRRRQAPIMQAWSGGLEAGQVTEVRAGSASHQTLPATEGCHASTTGQSRPAVTGSWRACARRWRRSVWAVTARLSAGKTLCGAGGGRTPSRSQRRGAGPHVARPVSRLACRRSKAVRRHSATLRSWSVSSRARLRSRIASSWTAGTATGVRSPARPGAPSGWHHDGPCCPDPRSSSGARKARRPSRHGLCGVR